MEARQDEGEAQGRDEYGIQTASEKDGDQLDGRATLENWTANAACSIRQQ